MAVSRRDHRPAFKAGHWLGCLEPDETGLGDCVPVAAQRLHPPHRPRVAILLPRLSKDPAPERLQGVDGKGNCYDSAAIETFFKTIKAELIWRRTWATRRQAEMAIFEYMNGTSKALSIGLEKPGRLRAKGGLNEHLGRHKSATGPGCCQMSLTKAQAARRNLIDCSWSWSFSSVKVRSANQTLAEEQPWPPSDPYGPCFAMRRLRSARATSGSYTNCWDTAP